MVSKDRSASLEKPFKYRAVRRYSCSTPTRFLAVGFRLLCGSIAHVQTILKGHVATRARCRRPCSRVMCTCSTLSGVKSMTFGDSMTMSETEILQHTSKIRSNSDVLPDATPVSNNGPLLQLSCLILHPACLTSSSLLCGHCNPRVGFK